MKIFHKFVLLSVYVVFLTQWYLHDISSKKNKLSQTNLMESSFALDFNIVTVHLHKKDGRSFNI